MKKNGLLRTVRMQVWSWPAVINFTLSGTGCGFYLINLFFGEMVAKMESPIHVAIYNLTAPLLVCLGFLIVLFEAGSPLKGKYLLNKLSTSWMSREVISGLAFICFAFSEIIYPNPVLKALAGTAAAGLLFSQGFMIYHCYAVTAWNEPIIPVHFFVSGTCLGFGLILAWAPSIQSHASILILSTGFIFLNLDAIIWIIFLRKNIKKSMREGTHPLRQHLPLKIVIGLGHLLPSVFLLILIMAIALDTHIKLTTLLFQFIGAIIICRGVYQKFALILRVNYFRKLELGDIKLNAYRP